MSALLMSLAVLFDTALGEPRRWHPLAGFGALASRLEAALNVGRVRTLRGVLAVALLIVPPTVLAVWLASLPKLGFAFEIVVLYFCIGHRSLREHAQRVAAALDAGDLPLARRRVGEIVSRDTQDMDETRVAAATIESVLENGNDAVFGALFWFFVAGAPGAIAYRLANTLDAMWGYRTARFEDFGWAAARLDDVLNYLPARLTALAYALLGRTRAALQCWWRQAAAMASPNGGPVMAAGAGSLGIVLGGGAFYHGQWRAKPLFGTGDMATPGDIARALRLVDAGVLLWLCVAAAITLAVGALRHA